MNKSENNISEYERERLHSLLKNHFMSFWKKAGAQNTGLKIKHTIYENLVDCIGNPDLIVL